jgi:ketosteroid isomerase-like protein
VSEAAAATGQVTVETLKQLLDAFNQHDLDRIMEFFSDDATLDTPRGPHPWGNRYVGHDEVRKGLATRFTGIPDVHYAADRHWVRGDRGASEWLLTGTSLAGQKIRVQGCDLFEFRNGKVFRKDSYWKMVE